MSDWIVKFKTGGHLQKRIKQKYMIKYPKTGQFRNAIQDVLKNYGGVKLNFECSIKAHGTNAGIVFYPSGVEYQSRERVLTLEQDNAGFMQAMVNKDLTFMTKYLFDENIVVYGEWCGGNIQKGVALTQLKEKIFIIFQVLVDGVSVPFKSIKDHEQGIYNIYDFPTSEIMIDFSNPIEVQNHLIELTTIVEDECPIGTYFGISGIGEGLVLRCIEHPEIVFKSKGEKHSVSQVKVLNSVDPDKLKSVDEFINYSVTEQRLNQGLENVEVKLENTGAYIKWVVQDIISEESDVLENSQLTIKDVQKVISTKAATFFKSKLV